MLPTMIVSRLLKSCAMPPVSWPTDLHLLRLTQGLLGLHALSHFLGNPLLERLVEPLQLRRGFSALRREMSSSRSYWRRSVALKSVIRCTSGSPFTSRF
jgi:hypothetical protein